MISFSVVARGGEKSRFTKFTIVDCFVWWTKEQATGATGNIAVLVKDALTNKRGAAQGAISLSITNKDDSS
jgi:chitodextrinase